MNPTDGMKAAAFFGQMLKSFRLRAGLGTNEFARMIGDAGSNVSAIEHGRRAAWQARCKLKAVANVLKLTPEEEFQFMANAHAHNPEIEARDKRIAELEREVETRKQEATDCIDLAISGDVRNKHKSVAAMQISFKNSEVKELQHQLATVTAERDGWKKTHDLVLSQAQKDNLRAEAADEYEKWLLDIGALCGCGHVDEQLPNCIRHEYRKIEEERDAAIERAEKAEADLLSTKADAAAMRGAIEGYVDAVGVDHVYWVDDQGDAQDCPEDDTCSCAHVIAINKAIDHTAGRDMLDELDRLREQNRKLMDGIANICASAVSNEIEIRETLKQLASELKP